MWMLRKHLEPSPGPGSPIPACRWVPVSSEGAGWRPAPFQATLLLKASASARVKRHFLAGPQGIMGRVCTWSLHLAHSHQGSTWPTSAGGRTCPPEEGPALWAGGHHANREKIGFHITVSFLPFTSYGTCNLPRDLSDPQYLLLCVKGDAVRLIRLQDE